MLRLCAANVAALLLAATVLPADAAPRQRRSADAPSFDGRAGGSLDGRVTGQPRTCGSDTFRYSSSGTTTGPYCH